MDQARDGEERDLVFMSAVQSLSKSKDSSFWSLLPKSWTLSIRDHFFAYSWRCDYGELIIQKEGCQGEPQLEALQVSFALHIKVTVVLCPL